MAVRRRTERTRAALAAALALLCAAGCGPQASTEVGATAQTLLSDNGLSLNGLSLNGLSLNGLSQSGLSLGGLATPEFGAWFAADREAHAAVMQYVVKCALPAGESLSYDAGDQVYSWPGNLGLAPEWSAGRPIPPLEQQLVTACLAAHVNAFGLHVEISVRGLGSDRQTLLRLDPGEEQGFPRAEGCFFGNLFDGSGVFAGAVFAAWAPGETNPRGCALEAGAPGACPPVQHLGDCDRICSPVPGASPAVYSECLASGVPFPALSTFLEPPDVYSCGDGVCQFTESPYRPALGAGCASDCGSLL